MDAEADRGARTAPSAAAGKHDAAAGQADPELLPRPGQPAAERAGRASEATGGLVEGEALEVAEHHRQPEGLGQAVDLAVEGLGLLAVDRRPVGRRGRRLGRGERARHRDLSSCRPPRAAAGGRSVAWHTAPSGSRPRTASCPAGRGRGSTGPSAPGPGTRPGRCPPHAARRPGAAGRRPAPSARAGPPAPRRRPRRPGRSRRRCTAPGAGGRRARPSSRPRRAPRAAGPRSPLPHAPCPIAFSFGGHRGTGFQPVRRSPRARCPCHAPDVHSSPRKVLWRRRPSYPEHCRRMSSMA